MYLRKHGFVTIVSKEYNPHRLIVCHLCVMTWKLNFKNENIKLFSFYHCLVVLFCFSVTCPRLIPISHYNLNIPAFVKKSLK